MLKQTSFSFHRFFIGIILISLMIVAVGLFSYPPNRLPHPRPFTPREVTHASSFVFPGGGLPGHRLIALYGTPSTPALGALGEQPLAESMLRAKALAAEYQPLSQEPIYPTLEIIASVASGGPTENGDYSEQRPLDELKPWVKAAKAAGVYVVLDLQPGRTDFLTQAKEFEPLLTEPHVGLALDPEWRLAPNQVHLEQIGHVGINEVNLTAEWLANLITLHNLPQKLFLIHQFRLDMIENREQLRTFRPELAYVIQVDGQGSQQAKQDTWQTLTADLPPNVMPGWKNFYDEDVPMRTPAETMQLQPAPVYVSYQ